MYSYEEALKSSIEYFNGDDLAASVWLDKYSLKDNNNNILEKTPEQTHRRLAKEFARIEANKFKKPLSEDEIFSYLDHFKYIVMQGSPMYGIGNPYQYVSLGNCFVIPPPQDSYLGIMYTDTEITQLTCRRGGVGWDVSKLRPNGLGVKNAAKSTTGMISFMKRFSNTIREVGMSGRRGASLQCISVHHPDILEFIKVKRDLTQITGSNISVKFTKEFFQALDNNEEIELRWPVSKEDADEMNVGFPVISKKIKAKEIWDEFIKGARDYAEPGAMYWDTVLSESTSAPYMKETASNPCQPENATVLTPDGIRLFKDVGIGSIIWSKDGWVSVINKVSTGINKIYKYITSCGNFLGTEDHKIISKGKKRSVKSSTNIDILTGIFNTNLVLNPQDILDGLIIGDGSVHKASNNLVYLCIGKNDHDYFNSEIKHLINGICGIGPTSYKINTTIKHNELPKTFERYIPKRFLYGSKSKLCGFLRGLYTANGSICGQRVTLKTSSEQIREDVQLALSSLGIVSYFTTNKPSLVKFSNGEYLCKQSYDINISQDIEKFKLIIGFIQQYKNEKLDIIINKRKKSKQPKTSYDIIEKIFMGEEGTYDITVSGPSHTYWTGGHNVSNCGEQFLPNYASCRLLILNLYNFVVNKFQDIAKFDFNKFKENVRILQRLGDDLVDLEIEAIDAIIKKIKSDPETYDVKKIGLDLWNKVKECALNDRRTGCGFTGLADCIAALNLKYDSDEAIKFIEKMQKTFKLVAYDESVEMAKELGSFPLYNKDLDYKSDFIKRIKKEDKDLFEKMEKYGRRNMTLLTIAPTGSVSCLTQTSSGLEPVFKISYTRRKKINPDDKNIKIDFIDQNKDCWTNYDVYHKGFLDWQTENNLKLEKSPYYKSTANDINWLQRIKIQSVLQKHIDNSISTTINLPNDISYETISDIYKKSFELGCKGCTVYREDCRTGVLIEKKDNKRPKELSCNVHHVTVKNQQYLVLVGMMNDKPYETFACKNGILDKNVKIGKIIRLKSNLYKAIFDDETELSPITASCSEHEETISRLTSLALRTGTDYIHIIDQLNKVQGDMTSYAKCIARVLKRYVKDGTTSLEDCPECKTKLVFNSGCTNCVNCGYSKCS